MKRGISIFGKQYKYMYDNDLHNNKSVDCTILDEMILIDEESKLVLYGSKPILTMEVRNHELFDFALSLKGESDRESLLNVLDFTSKIANSFDDPFEDMYFGGTEKEILTRGTDWCTDISRVGCVLLQCLEIPCRMVIFANKRVAYNGHMACEAFINDKFTLCDFLYGVSAIDSQSKTVVELPNNFNDLKKIYSTSKIYNDIEYIRGLFTSAAISEYDVTSNYNFEISKANEYYIRMMKLNHDGSWQLGED